MIKQEARVIYKEKRASLSLVDKNRFDDLLLINFQKLQLPHLLYVHTYIAATGKNEIETDHLLHFLEFRNPELKLVIPKMEKSTLVHIEYNEQTETTVNKWGIVEPVSGDPVSEELLDLILVPLLAFDEYGHRVGYGKGYYDKFLSKCRPNALKIGLSYFAAIPQLDDTEHFDIPLNYCITPHRNYEFR
jgi:5-formyltetrahydrofolate cyclo-ligase